MKTKLILGLILSLVVSVSLNAQQTLTATTPMKSPKASISQTLGITKIEVVYSRPAVREREVWGRVVRFASPSSEKRGIPWRAGANENTTVYFSTDVSIAGTFIKAGHYGLHMYVQENGHVDWLFSSNYNSWGSFYYDPEDIVATIPSQWEESDHVEHLKFEFDALSDSSVELSLNWGNKRIPVHIDVDVKKTTLDHLRKEMQTRHMINYMGPQEAADWCLRNDINFEEALGWADYSISFVKVFSNVKVKTELLRKLGREEEANEFMEEALSLGTAYELHNYGSEMLKSGDLELATVIFEYNAKKHPDTWPVNYGLAKVYSAQSNYKKAISYLEKASENCPENYKNMLSKRIDQLKNGEDIN